MSYERAYLCIKAYELISEGDGIFSQYLQKKKKALLAYMPAFFLDMSSR